METTLGPADLKTVYEKMDEGIASTENDYPGDTGKRQPVHTVYGGAHLFKAQTAKRIGELAMQGLKKYAPTWDEFNKMVGMECSDEVAKKVYQRVERKLGLEALEDFRIDFEDGFGIRSDAEEDEVALQAAKELASGMAQNTLPPFIGIRIKKFSSELKKRSMRTLDLFLTHLVKQSKGGWPNNFVVTYPKITSSDELKALDLALSILERKLGLPAGQVKVEMMVETPQSLFNQRGEMILPKLLKATNGRAVAAHFGTYDYTASIDITAEEQRMDHPACDFARSLMKVSLANTGVWVSDGATNIMPVGEKEVVEKAWRLSFRHIRHSLKNAYYQGWDLHPHQIPVRYAALYSFFLEGLDRASLRLKNFIGEATKATLSGAVFDDAATGQGLLNFFIRGLGCGAIDSEDVEKIGLTIQEMESRSFVKILQNRTSASGE